MKFNNEKEKIIIKSHTLNTNSAFDNSNKFNSIINNFITLQKSLNSFDIKNEFCDKMINLYSEQTLDNSTIKINS